MRKSKTNDMTCQRAGKPDELVMIAVNNPNFGKRFLEEYKKAKGDVTCQQLKK